MNEVSGEVSFFSEIRRRKQGSGWLGCRSRRQEIPVVQDPEIARLRKRIRIAQRTMPARINLVACAIPTVPPLLHHPELSTRLLQYYLLTPRRPSYRNVDSNGEPRNPLQIASRDADRERPRYIHFVSTSLLLIGPRKLPFKPEAFMPTNESKQMSCMTPKISKDVESSNNRNDTQATTRNSGAPLQAARRNLLKAIWDASFVPRFSSKPIDMDDYFSSESFAQTTESNPGAFSSLTIDNNSSMTDDTGSPSSIGKANDIRNSLMSTNNLTPFEKNFLANLLQSEDLKSIRRASERLADKDLFPPASVMKEDETASSAVGRILKRRESEVQQELFRLHQSTSVRPSTVLRRMSTTEKKKHATLTRAKQATASTPLIPPLVQSNSILTSPQDEPVPSTKRVISNQGTASTPLIPPLYQSNSILTSANDEPWAPRSAQSQATAVVQEGEEVNYGSWDMASDNEEEGDSTPKRNSNDCDEEVEPDSKKHTQDPTERKNGKTRPRRLKAGWDPFGDVNAWIDGNEGVEVDEDGIPNLQSPTSSPFKILGTSADDVSAHPHVLTPPLMEGLQQFMPESLHEYNFWLKYSLVREASASFHADGPLLLDMLRHCRASTYTVLAIETTDGNVFGAFCSQPWRLQGEKYWGSKDSFVWRMRHSRNDPCDSIVEQVLMESKIDIFPFTGRNRNIQQCSETHGLVLGNGEVSDLSSKQQEGEHYGNAIRLDPTMTHAWTSTCETFGNPCLVHTDRRGEKVEIANVELWCITPHKSLESAITSEMKQLFLAENRGSTEKNLDLFEILVGGTI